MPEQAAYWRQRAEHDQLHRLRRRRKDHGLAEVASKDRNVKQAGKTTRVGPAVPGKAGGNTKEFFHAQCWTEASDLAQGAWSCIPESVRYSWRDGDRFPRSQNPFVAVDSNPHRSFEDLEAFLLTRMPVEWGPTMARAGRKVVFQLQKLASGLATRSQ